MKLPSIDRPVRLPTRMIDAVKVHVVAVLVMAVPLALTACSAATKTVPGPTVTVPGPAVTVTTTATRTASAPGSQIAPEQCGPLLYGADGNYGNSICPDGHANVAAVDAYRSAGLLTIELDPAATPAQVHSALCTDNNKLTNPIRATLYKTAVALNGWRFPVDPLDPYGNLSGTCP